MESTPSPFATDSPYNLPALYLLAAGFAIRMIWSCWGFLNPDEALHYLLSVQPSLALTYKATLSTAHPPLLIVLLHYWSALGSSEWVLRFPSVVTGTGFCWVTYLWLDRVLGRPVATAALALLLFSPSLILLSAEVRQYGLLLFFAAWSLYWLDRAIIDNSWTLTLGSAIALYLALLTHYSALLLALSLGLYGLLRLVYARPQKRTVVAWIAGQIGALALIAFLLMTHFTKLEARGAPQAIADSYVRESIFRPSEEHAVTFIAKNTVRFFHYLFSQGAVGAVALALFILGIILLVRDGRLHEAQAKPTPRQMAFLITFPFVLTGGVALAGVYPYGGTRHDAYLAGFAMAGIAVALARWKISQGWIRCVVIAVLLILCNLFPSPMGQSIKPRNQARAQMVRAAQTLEALPRDSVIFTDHQGALMLSYYLCHTLVAQVQPPFQPFLNSECGNHQVIALNHDRWMFEANTFPEELQAMQQAYGIHSTETVWVFQAGWQVEKEDDLRNILKKYGGAPQEFGQNILLSPVTLP